MGAAVHRGKRLAVEVNEDIVPDRLPTQVVHATFDSLENGR